MAGISISRNSTSPGVTSWGALAIGVSIVVSAGALYGHYSQRWGPPVELVAAGAHLGTMPNQIGPWQLVEEVKMGETALTMLECTGYVNRRYINRESGHVVTVAIIVGPPGPTAVHSPEICYSSRAYQLQSKRKVVTIEDDEGDSHTFWSVNFKTRDLLADQLRVCYAWSRGVRWEASGSPRYEYAAARLLYKIQLASLIESRTASDSPEACQQFFKDLVNSNWTIKAS